MQRADQLAVHEATLAAINAEVMKARIKFPHNRHMLAALVEEVGELSEALLIFGGEKSRHEVTIDDIVKEAIQVACVAVRIIEEGDADFRLERGPHGQCRSETPH